MTSQQQEQRLNALAVRSNRRKKFSRKMLVIIVITLAIVLATLWILGNLKVIPEPWASISPIIIAVIGLVFTILQVIIRPDKPEPPDLVTLPRIVGPPPPCDPRVIQQREHVVKEVYTKLTQPNITAIALTGIGGVGKSTLAALVYRYAEEQRKIHPKGPFLTKTLWLTIDPAVTFAELAGNLFEALGKSLPNLSNLGPQNQAAALFNGLNTTNKPRLVILDQFENLLNWDTGKALDDRPGVGNWLDNINSQQCACRILLTSRPRPIGTREHAQTFLQEYPVGGLEMSEGIGLLRNRGVQGTEAELRIAVLHCAGHALSLSLLASLVHDHRMNLSTLSRNPYLWKGDIAINLLDQIYTLRLSDVQRKLLLAFSVYREAVSLDAVLAIIDIPVKSQVSSALRTLLTQHLLEAVGEGRYQLHAIIADYAQSHFDESSEQANEEALRTAHARAVKYYLQRAEVTCPPRKLRHQVSDIHDLIEVIWQYCQAGQWLEAYDLMEKEGIFLDFKSWGGNGILLELYNLLLPVDRWHPGPVQEAHIYNNLGVIYRILGHMGTARQYLEHALSICEKAEKPEELGWVLNSLGRFYDDVGKKERAQKCYEQALSYLQKVGDREGEGIVLNNLGRVYNELGRKDQVLAYLERALLLCREVGNREQENRALNNLGRIYNDLGQKEKALDYYQQALKRCREIGDRGGEGWTLNNLGKFHAYLGQGEMACEYLKQGLRIRREEGNRLGECRTLNNLAWAYIRTGLFEQALQCCKDALDIAHEIGDRMGEGLILTNYGRCYAAMGQRKQALRYYEEALPILQEVGDRAAEGRASNSLGQIYYVSGQIAEALQSYKKALYIFKEIKDQWGEAETLYNMMEFYCKQRAYEISFACLLLARTELGEVKHPLYDETQKVINKLEGIIVNEQFTTLVATIKPQAEQILDQALREEVE